MYSAQSSSNKCKNDLLKVCLSYSKFLDTIYNISLQLISPGDHVIKSQSML